MIGIVIWALAATLYGLFWLWYVGLGRPVTEEETERYIDVLSQGDVEQSSLDNFRQFFQRDDGKEFFIVNALVLKQPKKQAMEHLIQYQQVFMSRILKRAGHPQIITVARATSIEGLDDGGTNDWQTLALVRYRSRRDFGEIMSDTFGSDHHEHKLAALEKTFAIPAVAQVNASSVRVLVALGVALGAAVLQLVLI
jgi:hypothetical protein